MMMNVVPCLKIQRDDAVVVAVTWSCEQVETIHRVAQPCGPDTSGPM